MVVGDEVPSGNEHAVVRVGEVGEEALRQVESMALAAGAAVDDLGDGSLTVRADLDALTTVVARVVLSGIEGDNVVGRLVVVSTRPKPDIVVRHLSVVEALAETDGGEGRGGDHVRWSRLSESAGGSIGRVITLRLPKFVSACIVKQHEGDVRVERRQSPTRPRTRPCLSEQSARTVLPKDQGRGPHSRDIRRQPQRWRSCRSPGSGRVGRSAGPNCTERR
jgi:hypothetical protein